jgi:hypothetical protein
VVVAVLREPCRELAVPVEAEPWDHVAEQVVHGSHAVVRAAGVVVEEGVSTVPRHGWDLERARRRHGDEQVVVAAVRRLERRPHHAQPAWPRADQPLQQAVRLALELVVRRAHDRVGGPVVAGQVAAGHGAGRGFVDRATGVPGTGGVAGPVEHVHRWPPAHDVAVMPSRRRPRRGGRALGGSPSRGAR